MYEIIGLLMMVGCFIVANVVGDTNYLILAGLIFIGVTIIELPKYLIKSFVSLLGEFNEHLNESIDKINKKEEIDEK